MPPASLTERATVPESLTGLFEGLAKKSAVLLGEHHDCPDDHRWQLQMLVALHQLHPDMAVGFEMFPRRLQPVLDHWVAGQLSDAEFLQQAEWEDVWGFDSQLYLPLFRFARQHHLPMLALNVDHDLVKRVRAVGWAAVPEAERENVGRPAPPAPSYRTELQAIFDDHPMMRDARQDQTAQFNHFVEAQTLWDRAMAESIAAFLQTHPGALVVGILGAGHLYNGYGVRHQLQALGVDRIASLITQPSDRPCSEITPGLADAVFMIPPQPEHAPAPPPRLGVSLAEEDGEVRIETVMAGSLAERSGLQAGDIVLQAAGAKVGSVDAMRAVIQRQPAGTQLLLLIRRGGVTRQIVVRFPAQSALPAASPP